MPFNLARLTAGEVLALGARVRGCATADEAIAMIAATIGPELARIEVVRDGEVIAARGLAHSVQTVAGAAGAIAMTMWLATPVSPTVARALATLAPSLAIALGEAASEALLAAMGELAIGAIAERDAAIADTAQLRGELDALGREHAEKLRRSQRAMINVIEDLRDARDRLEHRVADRTSELQARNEELEQFAYIASHDLQEPLRTVAGYLQLIEQRYGAAFDQDGHEFIAFAVDGAQRMQQLIEALLAYSRIARREQVVDEVPLDGVLDDVLRSLEQAIKDASATIVRGPLPVVRGDRIQLGQLLQNLLSNALKFRGDAPARVEVLASSSGAAHTIVVRDQGIGFDNRFAERIFAVFRRLQRKYPGTGIGLAICKKIAERHHGSISASSAPGQGAEFTVILPA